MIGIPTFQVNRQISLEGIITGKLDCRVRPTRNLLDLDEEIIKRATHLFVEFYQRHRYQKLKGAKSKVNTAAACIYFSCRLHFKNLLFVFVITNIILY